MRELALGLVFLLTLGACATSAPSAGSPQNESPKGSEPLFTLDVKNYSGGSVAIYISGQRIDTVTGLDSCVEVYESDIRDFGSLIQLTLKPIGEEAFSAVPVNAYATPGWSIEVSPWPNKRRFDQLSIEPAEPCT